MSKISIITPCYFNEQNLPVTFPELLEAEKKFPEGTEVEYIFVDDGSKDNTYGELEKIQAAYPHKVKLIKLSRNFGSNNASYAGICHATGDCLVLIAADLQDPPDIIPQLFSNWQKGFKLVLAQKTNREDSFTEKLFSGIFHNLFRKFVLENDPKGGFDLWLIDKSLQEELIKMNEKNFHLSTLVIWMGYEYVSIPYTRRKRLIGTSRWTMSKKIKTFIDSFVAFTFLPLRMISVTGVVLGILAMVYASVILVGSFVSGVKVEGWSSLMLVLLFVSSFIMVSLGIIGEYLFRTLDAARNRPNFIVDKKVGFKDDKK